MKNSIAKDRAVIASHEVKHLMQNPSQKSIETWAHKFFFDTIRIELNNQGKTLLVIIYTFFIIFATISFFHLNRKNELIEKAVHIKIPQSTYTFNPEEMPTVKIDSSQLAYANKLLVDQVNLELMKNLDEREIKRNAVIKEKDEKIQLLNSRIEILLLQIDALDKFNNSKETKSTSYSNENEDILRKEQEIMEREFKNNQKAQREAFMGLLDLNKLEDQKKLQTYLDQQQLDIYRLQKAFEKERREFRTKTFRVASVKSAGDYMRSLQE